MKKLISLIALLTVAFALPAGAASTTVHCNANTSTNIVLAGAATISSISVANTNAATVAYVVLFDAPGITNGYNLSAYTSYSLATPASQTNVWTNFFGVVNSNVFTYTTNTQTAVNAQTSVLYPNVLTVEAPAVTTTTIPWAGRVNLGLLATNNGSCDITVTYRQ